MLYLLLSTYGSVFVCELVGDKNLYTITSLTIRFRPLYLFCGFTVAYMIKMGVAVLLGQAITELLASLLTITSTLTFFAAAFVIWFRRSGDQRTSSNYSAVFPEFHCWLLLQSCFQSGEMSGR
jgi:putative Ca2+/H+ antiporter (TMEM165/GDT1 family)